MDKLPVFTTYGDYKPQNFLTDAFPMSMRRTGMPKPIASWMSGGAFPDFMTLGGYDQENWPGQTYLPPVDKNGTKKFIIERDRRTGIYKLIPYSPLLPAPLPPAPLPPAPLPSAPLPPAQKGAIKMPAQSLGAFYQAPVIRDPGTILPLEKLRGLGAVENFKDKRSWIYMGAISLLLAILLMPSDRE